MSFFVGALPSMPGPSKIAGSSSKRGSDRNAPQPRVPISPSPSGAWRSRLEPIGVMESFTCRQRRRLMPTVGINRLRCLHVNDSMTPMGSNRDRHAPLGEGEIGTRGCGAFLSEPRFEELPAIFEGPGIEGKAPTKKDIDRAKELRHNGKRARRRRG